MKEKRCVVPARPLDIPHTRPAQASLTLRPAGLLNRLKRPLSRGSSPAGYPAEPLLSYQINRQLSGWNLPPLVIRAFGGALPLADLRTAANCTLFDHLIGAQQDRRRDRHADRFGGFEIDHRLDVVACWTGRSASFSPLRIR